MRPPKRARTGSRAASTLSAEPQTPIGATPVAESREKSEGPARELSLDPWTDEEEISLFKGIVRWKPAGVHKHFRMMALSNYMQQRGHDSKLAPHTSIPGIWRKLRSLYDLEAIDERENSIFEPEDDSGSPRKEPFRTFSLPEDQYGETMFNRGRASEPSSSPPLLDRPRASTTKRGGRASRSSGKATRASTVEDTEEDPKSTPVPTRPRKPTRNTRSSTNATPKSKISPEPKQSVIKRKRRTRAHAAEAEAEDVTGGEADGEEDPKDDDDGPPDDSTTAGSPATAGSVVPSKTKKTPGKQQEAPGGMDLRRSSRKK